MFDQYRVQIVKPYGISNLCSNILKPCCQKLDKARSQTQDFPIFLSVATTLSIMKLNLAWSINILGDMVPSHWLF
jgi:hypothetical protein